MELNTNNDVIVVEDNNLVRQSLQQLLEHFGYRCRLFKSAEDLMSGEFGNPKVLIFDFCLPGINGLDLLRWVRYQGYETPAVVISGTFDEESSFQANLLENVHCLQKPFMPDELKNVIQEFSTKTLQET